MGKLIGRGRTSLALVLVALMAWMSPLRAATPPPNYQGLWYALPAEAESGWGINFAHQGEMIFATWFTYDASGKGWWLVIIASQSAPGAYAGTIYHTRGPAFDALPFNPAAVTVTPVGSGALSFGDASTGSFTYTVNGVTQTKPITRQVFGPQPTCVFALQDDLARATNYQDLWYASPAESESGWGVNFAHQGDTVFATWFTYEASGAPMWLVAVAPRSGANAFAGTLYRTTGPAFDASPFRPERVTRTPVGDVTITFASGNAGTFRYSVNGVTQSKSITRQVFRAPGTTCQYAEGVWRGATDSGEAAVVVVLDGGSHFIYWGPAGGSGGHVVHGTARMDAGSFSSPHSLDYPVALAVETSDATSNYAISGTYAPGGDIVLSLAGDAGARKLTATFDAASTGSPDLAAVAGSYAGISGHVNGRRSATFTVAESGTVSGRNDRCTFHGRLTPRRSPAVFDFTLSAIGPCIFGTVNGIAQYHEPTRELRMFGLFAGGIDMYYVIGARQ